MSADEFGGFGFALGQVRGARSFDVDKLGRLTGVTFKQVWRPGENTAECRKGDDTWSTTYANLYNAIYGTVPTTQYEKSNRWLLGSKPVLEEPKPTKHSMDTCKCGFYGYYDGSNDYYQEGRVAAVVEGYGETIIGTRGFRAAKAKIVALRIPKHVPERLATLIARNYPDVPLFDKFSRMVAEFPPDANGQEVTPESDPAFWERPA